MKVSVIIPVYRVEKFIEKCAASLFSQTLDDVEFIFVDDASPDNSMALLEKCIQQYPQRKAQIRMLVHKENKGLPAARNTGLAVASGEYVFHCDSDDFVEPDMLETLYDEAKKKDADIVWCDWYLSFEHNERYMKQPDYATSMEALKAMLAGLMKFNVWNKLVRRRLYADNQIVFPAGYAMGEDMTMMLLFAVAGRVVYVPQAFYHYVKLNTEAYSQNFSLNHLESVKHNIRTVELFLHSRLGNVLDLEIACMKLEAKFPFLMSDRKEMYRLWERTYPEANAYILRNHYISRRRRWVQWCAAKQLWFLVRLHGWIVGKLIYGIIYR
ncbi:glycosyltransferase family 2 protein [Phocaeicola salanitronis]|uniref:glycosyltransferase family 2 protein n=1 Tax=Phocaeicola salanitronis TaxID=376805 RepID=UPI0023F7DFDE|nr:glycosyltransferase family 2 protein [Phocaeicola salanitronis]